MNLNTGKLLESMLNAAKSVLKKKWRSAKPYAENEFRKLLEEAVHIVYLMSLQRNSARMVMLTLEGLGIIAVEESINAALAAVRDTINSALGGWKLL
jgi:hypothetical protein